MSTICAARSRASRRMSLERASASARSCSLLLAAARPSAIFFCRVSMAFMMAGQKNFMTAHATKKKTTPWMTSVIAKFIAYSLPQRHSAPSVCLLETERAQERVGVEQQETDGHADDGHGVQQAGDDEHLGLQHVGEFRLASGAFEELAAQKAEADGGSAAAQADYQACCNHGGAHELSDLGHIFHCCLRSLMS